MSEIPPGAILFYRFLAWSRLDLSDALQAFAGLVSAGAALYALWLARQIHVRELDWNKKNNIVFLIETFRDLQMCKGATVIRPQLMKNLNALSIAALYYNQDLVDVDVFQRAIGRNVLELYEEIAALSDSEPNMNGESGVALLAREPLIGRMYERIKPLLNQKSRSSP